MTIVRHYRIAIVRNSHGMVAAAWLSVLAAPAAAQHSDALLASVAGKVVVGSASDIGGSNEALTLEIGALELIMRTGFAPPTPADFEADAPGFFSPGVGGAAKLAALGALPLPGSAAVTAQLSTISIGAGVDSRFHWDGVGAVKFTPVSQTQFGILLDFSQPTFGATDAGGGLDAHPLYQLESLGPLPPADGVYVVAPRIGVAGLETSDIFFAVVLVDALITSEDRLERVEEALEAFELGAPNALVDFGGGVTKDFAFYEEAVEWVESNLVVPEPTTPLLGLFASVFVAARASRRAAHATAGEVH
jgi:hypothetical protein